MFPLTIFLINFDINEIRLSKKIIANIPRLGFEGDILYI